MCVYVIMHVNPACSLGVLAVALQLLFASQLRIPRCQRRNPARPRPNQTLRPRLTRLCLSLGLGRHDNAVLIHLNLRGLVV